VPAFVVGDIHGNVEALRRLIEEARRLAPDVELYHVGDLIDRGPNSRAVVATCIAEGIRGVLGNHELWLCNVLAGEDFEPAVLGRAMSGGATLRSYGVSGAERTPELTGRALRHAVPADHTSYLLGLPSYRRLDVGVHTYWLVHAGLSTETVSGIRMEEGMNNDDEALLRLAFTGLRKRTAFWMRARVEQHGLHRFTAATQIMGHVPVRSAIIVPGHFLAIDTGCAVWPNGRLTGVLLSEDGRVQEVSVPGGFVT
jgi:hypothetical protein